MNRQEINFVNLFVPVLNNFGMEMVEMYRDGESIHAMFTGGGFHYSNITRDTEHNTPVTVIMNTQDGTITMNGENVTSEGDVKSTIATMFLAVQEHYQEKRAILRECVNFERSQNKARYLIEHKAKFNDIGELLWRNNGHVFAYDKADKTVRLYRHSYRQNVANGFAKTIAYVIGE